MVNLLALQDTGLSGCYDAVVDLAVFELCSDEYNLADARMKLTVTYADAATGRCHAIIRLFDLIDGQISDILNIVYNIVIDIT